MDENISEYIKVATLCSIFIYFLYLRGIIIYAKSGSSLCVSQIGLCNSVNNLYKIQMVGSVNICTEKSVCFDDSSSMQCVVKTFSNVILQRMSEISDHNFIPFVHVVIALSAANVVFSVMFMKGAISARLRSSFPHIYKNAREIFTWLPITLTTSFILILGASKIPLMNKEACKDPTLCAQLKNCNGNIRSLFQTTDFAITNFLYFSIIFAIILLVCVVITTIKTKLNVDPDVFTSENRLANMIMKWNFSVSPVEENMECPICLRNMRVRRENDTKKRKGSEMSTMVSAHPSIHHCESTENSRKFPSDVVTATAVSPDATDTKSGLSQTQFINNFPTQNMYLGANHQVITDVNKPIQAMSTNDSIRNTRQRNGSVSISRLLFPRKDSKRASIIYSMKLNNDKFEIVSERAMITNEEMDYCNSARSRHLSNSIEFESLSNPHTPFKQKTTGYMVRLIDQDSSEVEAVPMHMVDSSPLSSRRIAHNETNVNSSYGGRKFPKPTKTSKMRRSFSGIDRNSSSSQKNSPRSFRTTANQQPLPLLKSPLVIGNEQITIDSDNGIQKQNSPYPTIQSFLNRDKGKDLNLDLSRISNTINNNNTINSNSNSIDSKDNEMPTFHFRMDKSPSRKSGGGRKYSVDDALDPNAIKQKPSPRQLTDGNSLPPDDIESHAKIYSMDDSLDISRATNDSSRSPRVNDQALSISYLSQFKDRELEEEKKEHLEGNGISNGNMHYYIDFASLGKDDSFNPSHASVLNLEPVTEPDRKGSNFVVGVDSSGIQNGTPLIAQSIEPLKKAKSERLTCTDESDAEPSDYILAQVPCGHIFHKDCIEEWAGNHDTCPVCRANLSTGTHGDGRNTNNNNNIYNNDNNPQEAQGQQNWNQIAEEDLEDFDD